MAQDVHIANHYEESQQREDDKIFHGLGVGLAVVLVFRLAEDERLVGVAERLGYHCHYHGYLARRTVDAQLGVGVSVLVYVWEKNLIGCLVQNARDAEHKDRPAVRKHASQQCAVEHIAEAGELFHQAEHERRGAEQIDVEHVAHANLRTIDLSHE